VTPGPPRPSGALLTACSIAFSNQTYLASLDFVCVGLQTSQWLLRLFSAASRGLHRSSQMPRDVGKVRAQALLLCPCAVEGLKTKAHV
jgi:hypothetical protein